MTEVTVRHKIVSDGETVDIPNQAKEVKYHIDNDETLHITWLEPDVYGGGFS